MGSIFPSSVSIIEQKIPAAMLSCRDFVDSTYIFGLISAAESSYFVVY
jgi:hypothetical protein